MIGTDGARDRRALGERVAPARELRLVGQNAKVANIVEHVEITEYRAKRRIDQREVFAVEPWRRADARFEPRKLVLQRARLGLECRLVLGAVEAGDIIQHG